MVVQYYTVVVHLSRHASSMIIIINIRKVCITHHIAHRFCIHNVCSNFTQFSPAQKFRS